jgi:hypothetical protein
MCPISLFISSNEEKLYVMGPLRHEWAQGSKRRSQALAITLIFKKLRLKKDIYIL